MMGKAFLFGPIVVVTLLAFSWLPRSGLRMASVAADTLQSPCEAWERAVSKLSEIERHFLAKEGAVYNGNLILSERMVTECNLRGQMSSYFGKVLRGETDDITKVFARGHSREVVGVLRRIWPSTSNCKALVADGSVEGERYNLLADVAIQPRVITPLIAEIVAKERLGNDLAYVLFSRPLPHLRDPLVMRLGKAERSGDIPEQIYSLAVLQRLGEPSVLTKLVRLSRCGCLSKFETKLVANLVTRIRGGKTLAFADVEDLEYMNDR